MLQKLSEVCKQVERLTKLTKKLVKENRLLHEKVDNLEQQLAQKEELYTKLEEKYEITKLTKSVGNGEAKKELIDKINKYISEIDTCLKSFSD